MIVGSLLLILVAVVLLVLGLTDGSSVMLTGSIAASLLAAVALVVGARQDNGTSEAYADGVLEDEPHAGDEPGVYALAGTGRSGQGGLHGSGSAPAESATVTLPTQATRQSGYTTLPPAAAESPGAAGEAGWDESGATVSSSATIETGVPPDTGTATVDDDDLDEEDPPDEPAPQIVPAADAARVARLATDVLVIDGRPRYHLPGCVHLLGRESEPLPVSEAVELGFTPCSLCEPANALLTDPRRT